jgi:hypothetical protein
VMADWINCRSTLPFIRAAIVLALASCGRNPTGPTQTLQTNTTATAAPRLRTVSTVAWFNVVDKRSHESQTLTAYLMKPC